VNDGSRDGTGSVMERLALDHPEITTRHHNSNRGIEAAWATGLQAAHGTLACLIDADLQNQPEDITRLLGAFREEGADVVQGRRVPIRRGFGSRYLLSRALNALLNLVFGMRLKDNKSGFILASRDTVLKILEHRYRYRYFQALLLVSAHSKGMQVVEIDTLFANRGRGTSFMTKIPLRVIIGCLLDVAKGTVEFRILGSRGSVSPGT
jgi:phenylacetate-CoA ligase